MVNMMKLMKQAQSMQKNMEKLQADLAAREYEATSGGGMVKAVVQGSMTLNRVEIDPKVVDPSDVDMLQDLVVSAVNTALSNAREDAATEMAKVTGGMGLPGMM
ncbi:MAG TPA: YbaB/EbfC family nucleoid-associated protein [Kiritimatiellia bacterium]|nr:YbaB/EbfC family nucleoid-associated protein [Kiritimatiellia bacterium]HMO97763.1 YbaB/EbfC family nucleoid-associated protein [Kiritimatiellia bacterium]HMP95402.1 YbaB/EbfC family nucleoid-associated protein [Kiritimatiellia bacterium]